MRDAIHPSDRGTSILAGNLGRHVHRLFWQKQRRRHRQNQTRGRGAWDHEPFPPPRAGRVGAPGPWHFHPRAGDTWDSFSWQFVPWALRSRKALGGGMRQAGVIAAPMLVALKDIVPQLKEDHARARRIAQAVRDVGKDTVLTVDVSSVQSNIVMLQTTQNEVSSAQVAHRLAQVTEAEVGELGEKIQVSTVPFSETTLRLVTYHGITDEDVDKSIRKIQYVLKEMASL